MNVSILGRRVLRRSLAGAAVVTALGLVVTAGFSSAGCGSSGTAPSRPVATAPIPVSPELDAEGHPAGIERYRKWSEKLGQGAQPEGEVAFRNLAAMGYATIVSVDGAKPDVENAARYGLRYVHLPFGYDGVPKDVQSQIVKVCALSEGPVFIHCHHGQHRGPAAAMIARIAVDGISNEEAISELKASGCAEAYKGLYRDIRSAVPPTEAELDAVSPDLPSYVFPGDLTDQMVALDATWDRVTKVKDSAWKTPAAMPDVDPAHEVRILWERVREMGRLEETRGKGDEFLAIMARAEEAGHALEAAIEHGDAASAAKSYAAVKSSCTDCHGKWRNN